MFPKIWVICRVCLKQQEILFNIFDESVDKQIWTSLRDCGGVPVRRNDNLPDKICDECLRKLRQATHFRIDCQRGHRDLVQMLINRNALMYQLELEEEKDNSSEFNTISGTKSDCESTNFSFVLEKYFETCEPKESTRTISVATCIDYDESIPDIKQYCVATKSDVQEKNLPEFENKPIALLLKLKDMSPKEIRADANKIEAATKTTHKLEINNQMEAKISKTKLKSKFNITKANFSCKICGKTCKSYTLLRHHMYTHKRPHQCKICHKRFSQKSSFLSHLNQYTGDKPYKCRTCFKTFADASNRNSHERKRHNKQEFKCEKCKKVFRFLDLLRRHEQSHRPKKCFICNKEFCSLQNVRKHHQNIHLRLNN